MPHSFMGRTATRKLSESAGATLGAGDVVLSPLLFTVHDTMEKSAAHERTISM
jgi:hypothetical protein